MLAPRALRILPGMPHLKTAIRPNNRLPATRAGQGERESRRVNGNFRQPGNGGQILHLQDLHGAISKYHTDSATDKPECQAFH
jgi:hypothetical protein